MSSAQHPSPTQADPQRGINSQEFRQLGVFVRRVTVLDFAVLGVIEGLAFLTGSLRIGLIGIPVLVFGVFLLWAWPRATPEGASRFVTEFCIVTFALVVTIAWILPSVTPSLTAAGLVPVAVGLTYINGTWLRRLMAAAWSMAVLLAIASETTPPQTDIPSWAIGVLNVVSISSITALLLFLLWQYRSRLTDSARELGGLVELSRDLADTMDPHLVGERMARHLAEVSGAFRCVISSWDRTEDAVLTYAAFPPNLAGQLDPVYRLGDYPLTRRVLETKQPITLHVDDPDADPQEVALLRNDGQTALVLLPLVAKGETIGLIELTRVGQVFGEREMMLAFTFASEAAMALENARLYQQLHHQAFHDPLTRLANRSLFTDRLGHALARRQRLHAQLALLFIDVDDLKTVNDRLGHATGDAVLVAFADRLQLSLRDGDTAARIGGDEFAVLLEDLTDPAEAEAVARRILDVMSQPIPLNGSLITSGVSIGICTTASGMETADAVMRNADYAMYQAKLLGRGRVEVFRPSMRQDATNRQTLETLLHGAVERNELRVQYQPVVAMGTGRIAGMEALIRWDSPERGTLMPGDFIALAEETGLIVPIGRWILEEACRQTREWQRLIGRDDLGISVNLSGRQFQHPALLSDILAALASTGLDASSLVVEITESILMLHTPSTMATLEALRKAGVRVAVDDFGTGYSSLAYLQRFPIDILKVDRTFVEHSADGGDGAVLARVIIELARALRLRVIAEGIEEFEQLEALLSFGCGHGQGYLLSRPVNAAEMQTLLTDRPRPWDHHWARIREATARIPSAS